MMFEVWKCRLMEERARTRMRLIRAEDEAGQALSERPESGRIADGGYVHRRESEMP